MKGRKIKNLQEVMKNLSSVYNLDMKHFIRNNFVSDDITLGYKIKKLKKRQIFCHSFCLKIIPITKSGFEQKDF